MSFSEESMLVMWTVQLICGTLSSISCLLICIIYFCNPYLRGYEFRLVFYLCSSDLLSSILYTIPPHDNIPICHLQGFLLSLAIVLGLAFTVVIATSIHATHKGTSDRFRDNERFYLVIIFIVGLVAAVLPFTTGDYGRPLDVCWIELGSISGNIWKFALFLGPIWIILMYNCYVYYVMIKSIRSLRTDSLVENGDYIETAVRKLWFYPAVLVIGWLPASINTVIEYMFPGYYNLYLSCIGLGFVSGIGFMNSIVYGLNSEVREVICKKFCVRKTNEFEME